MQWVIFLQPNYISINISIDYTFIMPLFEFQLKRLLVLREGKWHHFPQRSDITLQFFKSSSDITITVIWKAVELLRVRDGSENVVSYLCRYPAIGLKSTDAFGALLKRCQFSFHEGSNQFEQCVEFLKENGMNVVDVPKALNPPNKTSDSLGKDYSQEALQFQCLDSQITSFKNVQLLNICLCQATQSSQIAHNHSTHNHSTHNHSNLSSICNSKYPIQLQYQQFQPYQLHHTHDAHGTCVQPTDENLHVHLHVPSGPTFESQLTEHQANVNLVSEFSTLFIPTVISPVQAKRLVEPNTYCPLSDISPPSQSLKKKKTVGRQKNKDTDLTKLSDVELQQKVREVLKDPTFIEFVKRLEKIICGSNSQKIR